MEKTPDFAGCILNAFDDYHDAFRNITRRAGRRFVDEDWAGFRGDTVERLDVYGRTVDRTVTELQEAAGDAGVPAALWSTVKQQFDTLLENRNDYQLAATFFNSVSRRVFSVIGVNQAIEFTVTEFRKPLVQDGICPDCSPYGQSSEAGDIESVLFEILSRFSGECPFSDMRTDSRRAAGVVAKHIEEKRISPDRIRVEMVDPVFYRDKLAYLIGRIICSNGADDVVIPLVFCILNINGDIFVDAVLLDEADVSILFSFAHSYFHVDVTYPEDLVAFLKTILPAKRVSEIYTSLGYHKHGKSEFFRELTRSLEGSSEQFEIARGEQGMVMCVITIASFNVVFKIIRDRFDYPKKITPDVIRDRYDLVFKHDRVGRLVDAQEFRYMKFDRGCFSEELLRELSHKINNNMVLTDDHLIIKHLYTERRLTPLDIYVRENPPEAVKDAFLDYGWAVKEMAASNIFPGDLLYKNFGVTRHGRVVFYDYDELSLLTECRFRKMPEPRTYDEVMADEPWFPVFEDDVFPEEFRTYIQLPDHVKEPFEEIHGNLFDYRYWKTIQERVKSDIVIYILPYKNPRRLEHHLPQNSHILFFNHTG